MSTLQAKVIQYVSHLPVSPKYGCFLFDAVMIVGFEGRYFESRVYFKVVTRTCQGEVISDMQTSLTFERPSMSYIQTLSKVEQYRVMTNRGKEDCGYLPHGVAVTSESKCWGNTLSYSGEGSSSEMAY